jgi:hypothetical protein
MSRHGGAYDRGRADSYYHRSRRPHYFRGGTYDSAAITIDEMTVEQIEAYNQGYDECDIQKEYE